MQCWHMSGAGNDFMVIDARGLTLDFETLSKELCARAGADGFMAVIIPKRRILSSISTIPTVPGVKCAATAAVVSAGSLTITALPEKIWWSRPMLAWCLVNDSVRASTW